MRVLLAHAFFQIRGGGDIFFFETGRILKQHGHSVAWFSTASEDNEESEYARYFVGPPSYRSSSTVRQVLGLKAMVYSREAKENFAKLISAFRPDVVHAFGIQTHLSPSILRAAQEAGVPVVMSCNDYKHICPNYKLYHHGRICTDCNGGRFYKAITNRCCKDSWKFSVASSIEAYAHAAIGVYKKDVDRYLFASGFMAETTERFWAGQPFVWSMLRNPFDGTKVRARESGDYILFFGRLVEEKGVDVLLSALARLPELPLRVVGDGPLLDRLKVQASDLGLRDTQFVGPKWGRELDEVLSNARFVVVPSVWHENFPYVVLQAFAASKPVVGSDRGGIPELVQDGRHGSVYPAHDEEVLAAVLATRWSDQDGTAAMGRAAKRYVDEEFNDERFYTSLMGIYRSVLR